ncbi:sodium:proton antiporter [Candidatus Nanohalococcus occultus]|uniref:sodium:proton antiporter n=1 Tax=Candidatus Nanohalococcus occultus TaxID=2978047 RepID=UPI0039E0E025
MSLVIAITLGVLFASGTYLILRKDALRVVIGALVLSQVANIYLMAMGRTKGGVPIISHGSHGHGVLNVSDPLPQAMVLTAIVIGFATTSFLLSLIYRFYEENQEIDLESLGEEHA